MRIVEASLSDAWLRVFAAALEPAFRHQSSCCDGTGSTKARRIKT
jgi:hypothetical protein